MYLEEELLPKKQVQEAIVNIQKVESEFAISGGTLICYRGNKSEVVIPNGVVRIGENAFKNTQITSLEMPPKLLNINNALSGSLINTIEISKLLGDMQKKVLKAFKK